MCVHVFVSVVVKMESGWVGLAKEIERRNKEREIERGIKY